MASVSYGINRGPAAAGIDQQAITKGTVAASGNDIVLSIDLTKSVTVRDAVLALDLFKERLLSGGIGNVDIASN